MKELVIVPTYQRSEFLYVVIDAIRAAEPDMEIHVFPDKGTTEHEVCEELAVEEHLTWAHSYYGNTANVMEALKWAARQKVDVVYVIEDDAVIDPSFFEWSRQAICTHVGAFAACGWRYSPDALPPGEGPDILIPWYLSVATGLPRRSVVAVAQHASLLYYADMQGYVDRTWPFSPRKGSKHYEQDGLTLRVMEQQGRMCAWPRRPRATHVGFCGYHMPNGKAIPGTLAERVHILKLVIQNPSLLGSLMAGGPIPEIDRCRKCGKPLLTQAPGSRLECVECYHAEYPERVRTSESHYYFPKEVSV